MSSGETPRKRFIDLYGVRDAGQAIFWFSVTAACLAMCFVPLFAKFHGA